MDRSFLDEVAVLKEGQSPALFCRMMRGQERNFGDAGRSLHLENQAIRLGAVCHMSNVFMLALGCHQALMRSSA